MNGTPGLGRHLVAALEAEPHLGQRAAISAASHCSSAPSRSMSRGNDSPGLNGPGSSTSPILYPGTTAIATRHGAQSSKMHRHCISDEALAPCPGLKVGHGAVVCLADERLPLTAQVDAVPAWQVA